MEVRELQAKILELEAKWSEKRNYTPTEQALFNYLIEEVGGLARQFVNLDQGQDRYNEAELENSLGDILIIIVQLATLRGLDVEDVLVEIVEEETKDLSQ